MAETAAVLARRWQTKVTDDMTVLLSETAGMLDRLHGSWASLHPR